MPLRDPVARAFVDAFDLRPGRPDAELLWAAGAAFRRLPYENLTKLIRRAEASPGAPRRRAPADVLAEHLARGTGGTCFALTELFRVVLTDLGFRCRPALCDMGRRTDAHCALVVDLPDGPVLMDPGYLLDRPLPLVPGEERGHTAGLGEVVVRGLADGAFEVATFGVARYRAKPEPVAPARFRALWEASFDWAGLNGVHVSQATDGGYAYVHDDNLRLRTAAGKENVKLKGARERELGARFGLAPDVVRRAYALVDAVRAARASGG